MNVRIYQNSLEMVREVERDLFEMGHRYQSHSVQDQDVENDPRFETIELVGYAYRLSVSPNWESDLDMLKYLRVDESWVQSELADRLNPRNGLNPGNAWTQRRDFWSQFLRDGMFAYTYPERFSGQLIHAIEELRRRPNTRQAIVTVYDQHQDRMNWGGRDRVPCSLSYHFIRRGNDLTIVYSQRSCDFLKFFGSDVYLANGLLRHVQSALGLVGTLSLVHVVNSLHAFAGDMRDRGIF